MRQTPHVLAVLALAGMLLGISAQPAAAHPLGNFSVNRYDGLRLHPDRIVDKAIVDFAEIPTLQEQARVNAEGPTTYAARICTELAGTLQTRVDGHPLTWAVTRSTLAHHPGAAGLQTSRLSCDLTAAAHLDRPTTVDFANDFRGDRVGWREITAHGQGVHLTSSTVPAKSVSAELRHYPQDLLTAPLNLRTAQIKAEPGTGAGPATDIPLPGADMLSRWTGSLTATVDRLAGADQLTLPVGLLALLLALVLGGAHATLPGHGKTVMAAYIAGRQGHLRDAMVVGATVTLTHTAGVLALGLLLTISASVAGDSVLGYLGVASGLLIAVIGAGLLRSAIRHLKTHTPTPAAHSHHPGLIPIAAPSSQQTGALADRSPHGHGHGHGHGHDHGHGSGQGHRVLVGLGVAGGLVPSPSALVVLLGAIALGRTAFGVAMVISYGVGMAATLTAAGLLLVRMRDGARKAAARRGLSYLRRIQPYTAALTAGLVLLVGAGLAIRSLSPLLY